MSHGGLWGVVSYGQTVCKFLHDSSQRHLGVICVTKPNGKAGGSVSRHGNGARPPTGNLGLGGSVRQLSDSLLRRYPQTQAWAGTGWAGGRPGNSSACPTLGTGWAGAKVTLSVGAELPGPGVFLWGPVREGWGPKLLRSPWAQSSV